MNSFFLLEVYKKEELDLKHLFLKGMRFITSNNELEPSEYYDYKRQRIPACGGLGRLSRSCLHRSTVATVAKLLMA